MTGAREGRVGRVSWGFSGLGLKTGLITGLATALAVSLAMGVAPSPAHGQDWPHFRGPTLDGGIPAAALETGAGIAFEEVWRRELGSGYSGIVVVGSTAVTVTSREERNRVVALEVATGRELWSFDLAPLFPGRQGSDDGPISTPTVSDGRVFVLDPAGRLVALDLQDGRLLWDTHLVEDLGAEMPLYGFSSHPLAADGQVVVQAGAGDGRLLVALDAASGEVRWTAGEDVTQYENPMLWDGPGGRQVVVVGQVAIAGYRWQDGQRLWSHEREGAHAHAGDVVPVDQRRLLVHHFDPQTVLLEVGPKAGATGEAGETEGSGHSAGFEATVVWSTNRFDRTYAIPLLYAGRLYGFDGRFLVAVDLETGEEVWKSRPPGGTGLIRAGDHLLILGGDGELVAVETGTDRYRESGRIGVFDRGRVFTPVTYSDGWVLARNLEEMVALRARAVGDVPRDLATRELAPAEVPEAIAALLETVGAEELEQAMLERHREGKGRLPLVGEDRVHFVWLGDEEDIAVVGDMTGGYREVPLRKVPGTRVWLASFERPEHEDPKGERWEYVFKSFEEERLDPHNPRQIEGPEGKRSVLELPGWQPAPQVACTDCPRGELTEVEVPAGPDRPDRSYRMTVYTPPGYGATGNGENGEAGEARYPLVIFTQGEAAVEFGRVPGMLDALIAEGGIRPVVAAFLELPEAAWWPPSRPRLYEILDSLLIPHLETAYRIHAGPGERALVAQGWAFESSLRWALEGAREDAREEDPTGGMGKGAKIAKMAIQSPMTGAEALADLAQFLGEVAPSVAMELQVDWGRSDARNEEWGLDVPAQSPELAKILREHGHRVVTAETPGGGNWTRWSARLPAILEAFFAAE